MRVHLVAVQAALSEGPYRSAESFAAWTVRLGRAALAEVPSDGAPVLLAFPEAIAMPLLFTLGGGGPVDGSATLLEAAGRSLRGSWTAVLAAAWRYRSPGPAAALLARAPVVYDAYVDAFREVARVTGATVVGGSALLPDVELEAARGRHVTSRRVYNVSYTFAPSGVLLGRSRKVHLTPGLEGRIGLARGRVEDLPVMRTPCGPVGVAVCLDGWYDGVVATLDAHGAEVLVQPSANEASWTRPWPPDPSVEEGEAWLGRGLRALLQERVNLRYGVNPMLVGDVFGFSPRGRSSILANAALVRHPWAEGREGVAALAPSAEQEAIVVVTAELSDRRPNHGSVPSARG
ncbi:MAG: nitrilase-related carbon-nitrogen hydrolase [Deinococcales bacterium]